MDFIAGSWADPQAPDGVIENRSPADLSVVLGRHAFAEAQVDRAVAAAREALRAPGDRVALVRAIGAVLAKREEELARAIALDVGKPLWEARTEAQACAAKAAITVEDGMKLVAGFPARGQPGAECRFRPLGVMAVLGPFNFPVHLPNGHILPALACGNDGVFMGPLASPAGLEKFEKGLPADVEALLSPRRLAPRGLQWCYVSPSVHFVQNRRNSAYEREELFGPDLAVYPAASEEEAIEIANATDYGLAASVHTASEESFRRCQRALECGVVNWNAPTVGASGRLPFGGLKRSGNHRPAALFSTLYCAAPVAVLHGEPTLDRAKLAPGISWVDE